MSHHTKSDCPSSKRNQQKSERDFRRRNVEDLRRGRQGRRRQHGLCRVSPTTVGRPAGTDLSGFESSADEKRIPETRFEPGRKNFQTRIYHDGRKLFRQK